MEYDYYLILGVSVDATQEEIIDRYRTLVSAYHPDRYEKNSTRAEHATEETQRINQAFQVLGNPTLRKRYDQEQEGGTVSDSQRLEAQLKEAEAKIAKLEKQLGSHLQKTTRLQNKVDMLEQNNLSLRDQVQILERDLDQERTNCQRQESVWKKQVDTLQEQLDRAELAVPSAEFQQQEQVALLVCDVQKEQQRLEQECTTIQHRESAWKRQGETLRRIRLTGRNLLSNLLKHNGKSK